MEACMQNQCSPDSFPSPLSNPPVPLREIHQAPRVGHHGNELFPIPRLHLLLLLLLLLLSMTLRRRMAVPLAAPTRRVDGHRRAGQRKLRQACGRVVAPAPRRPAVGTVPPHPPCLATPYDGTAADGVNAAPTAHRPAAERPGHPLI